MKFSLSKAAIIVVFDVAVELEVDALDMAEAVALTDNVDEDRVTLLIANADEDQLAAGDIVEDAEGGRSEIFRWSLCRCRCAAC